MTIARAHLRINRIDWFRVIVDLEREKWSLERIADHCERSKGWVSNLKSIPDTEPRFYDGCVMIALWASVTGKKREQAPTIGQDIAR